MEQRKTEKSNLENKRSIFFLIGLLAILSINYAAFSNRTFYDDQYNYEMQVEDDLIELPPIVINPILPPPTPVEIIKPLNNENLEIVPNETKIEDIDFKIDFTDLGDELTDFKLVNDIILNNKKDTLTFAQNQAHFPECANLKSNIERDQCTRALINQKILNDYKIPTIDREIGVKGMIQVQFIVSSTGEITDAKIINGINERLNKEAIRTVEALPRMIPGRNFDKEVSQLYIIPININVE